MEKCGCGAAMPGPEHRNVCTQYPDFEARMALKYNRPKTSPHYQRVVKFMQLAGQVVSLTPTTPDHDIRLLRAKLILEEALETIEALGFRVSTKPYEEQSDEGNGAEPVTMDNVNITSSFKPDLVEIADGCADLMVVTTGTLIACGIHDMPLQELVDQNNLDKFGPGGYRRPDGKWVKPAGHRPPDIAGLLSRQ